MQIKFITIILIFVGCSKPKGDGNEIAIAALLASRSTTATTTSGTFTKATTSWSGNGALDCTSLSTSGSNQVRTCVSNDGIQCTSTFGSGVPDWIKNNFNCVTVSVSGSNYLFNTKNVPVWKSIYWGSSSPNYETSMYATSNKANPNLIATKNYTLTIPVTPTLSNTGISAFPGVAGVTVDGLVIYNNEAAPGDSLAVEYATFDDSQAHPDQGGNQHYHVEPPKITNDSNDFLGIFRDGYLLFGKKDGSSYPTLDSLGTKDCTPTSIGYSGSTKCYYVRNGSGVNAFLISSFRGIPGSVSQ